MSGHTPGPWEQDPTGDVGWWFIGTAKRPVAEVMVRDSFTGLTAKEARANARLIAAAPDLLKAVGGIRWLSRNMHNYGSETFKDLFVAAAEDAERAAAKAEGR